MGGTLVSSRVEIVVSILCDIPTKVLLALCTSFVFSQNTKEDISADSFLVLDQISCKMVQILGDCLIVSLSN